MELTNREIESIEAARYETYAEAELNADDLANDNLDAIVVPVRPLGNGFSVKVIR